MTLSDWFTLVIASVGAIFCVLAGVGTVRMPDAYTRMQAATKAGTLGVALTLIAVSVHFGESSVVFEVILIITLFFITAPIASYFLAGAGYARGSRPWVKMERDDLATRGPEPEGAAPDPLADPTDRPGFQADRPE